MQTHLLIPNPHPPAPGVRPGDRGLPGHHHRRRDSVSSQVTHVFWEIVQNLLHAYVYAYAYIDVVLFFCSYPYSEDYTKPTQYMNTRCPSWCDRILMSHNARDVIYRVSTALRNSHVLPTLFIRRLIDRIDEQRLSN